MATGERTKKNEKGPSSRPGRNSMGKYHISQLTNIFGKEPPTRFCLGHLLKVFWVERGSQRCRGLERPVLEIFGEDGGK